MEKNDLKKIIKETDIIDRNFIKHIQSNKKNIKCPNCGRKKTHSSIICECEFMK